MKGVEEELIRQGLTAKEATAAVAGLSAATVGLGDAEDVATGKIDRMTGAMAYSAVRLASNEAGACERGFALARLGGISTMLAPMFEATFPIFFAVAFLEIIGTMVDKFEKFVHLGDQAVTSSNELTETIGKQLGRPATVQ